MRRGLAQNDPMASGSHRLHVWLLPVLGLVAVTGLVWVRGRNFISVGTEWQVVLPLIAVAASAAVMSSPFQAHRSLAALLSYGALLAVVGFVSAPAAYTAAFGTRATRVFIVAETVQVRAGGCSRMIKLAEFEGRFDNRVCVPDHIYRFSAPGTKLVVSARESNFGVWLDSIALGDA